MRARAGAWPFSEDSLDGHLGFEKTDPKWHTTLGPARTRASAVDATPATTMHYAILKNAHRSILADDPGSGSTVGRLFAKLSQPGCQTPLPTSGQGFLNSNPGACGKGGNSAPAGFRSLFFRDYQAPARAAVTVPKSVVCPQKPHLWGV